MKVIAAGFSRTGTMSLQVALQKLGYRTYHMFEALANFENGHMKMWNNYMEGKKNMDWQRLFADYDASTDLPACIYWREMLNAFPDSKVVLTVREADKWWLSWRKLVKAQEALYERWLYLPRFQAFYRLGENIDRIWFGNKLRDYDREDAIRRYKNHNAEVEEDAPPERLLITNIRDGWKPLCEFLGHPVPEDEFPHENAGNEQVEAMMARIIFKDMLKHGTPPSET
jgi:hypothetical protein